MAEETTISKWKGKATTQLKNTPPQQIWPLFEDFCSLHKWLPTIDTCHHVEGQHGQPGLVRYCASTVPSSNDETIIKWCHEKLVSIDYYETRIDGVDGETVGLFGVFDGHGGARAAEYVKHNLFSNLIKHPKFISDTKSAIAESYSYTDSELLKSDNNSQIKDAGSTASTAILVGNRLLVANVGDSRAVICRSGNAFAASRDHKPDQSDERRRIEDAGGFVMWAGTWRVGGVLAVSRAFGDKLLKQFVVADPEIQEEKIDDSLEFLILASDGLWDVVTNDEAVAMVKPIKSPEDAAKTLMEEASQRGSADNITVVIVRFLAHKL